MTDHRPRLVRSDWSLKFSHRVFGMWNGSSKPAGLAKISLDSVEALLPVQPRGSAKKLSPGSLGSAIQYQSCDSYPRYIINKFIIQLLLKIQYLYKMSKYENLK